MAHTTVYAICGHTVPTPEDWGEDNYTSMCPGCEAARQQCRSCASTYVVPTPTPAPQERAQQTCYDCGDQLLTPQARLRGICDECAAERGFISPQVR